MRTYNHERYLARKAGTLVQTGPNRPGWNKESKIMDPSHEWIFEDHHWEEYDINVHGPLAGFKIIEKDFDEAI